MNKHIKMIWDGMGLAVVVTCIFVFGFTGYFSVIDKYPKGGVSICLMGIFLFLCYGIGFCGCGEGKEE